MSDLSFMQRFSTNDSLITGDFPKAARKCLVEVLEALVRRRYVDGGDEILAEVRRVRGDIEVQVSPRTSWSAEIAAYVDAMEWTRVYQLCERVYRRCLREIGGWQGGEWEVYTSLDEVKRYYTEEIDALLSENGIGYEFVDGTFQRRGRAQTQKMMQRVGTVLSQPRLAPVRTHYAKARKFFEMVPDPDSNNCIKESMCALEACIEVLTDKKASNDFEKALKQLEGNSTDKIPPPIAQSMSKLFGYRGGGQGVAHAAISGNRVSPLEAELVLNLTASYITYLADLFPEQDEIPF